LYIGRNSTCIKDELRKEEKKINEENESENQFISNLGLTELKLRA
jgi:hypothetical protein